MFEVGKTYKRDKNKGYAKATFKVSYVGTKHALGIYNCKEYGLIDCETIIRLNDFKTQDWEEYKGPLKGTSWIIVYKYSVSDDIFIASHDTKEKVELFVKQYKFCNTIPLAIVEVPWIEGQGL